MIQNCFSMGQGEVAPCPRRCHDLKYHHHQHSTITSTTTIIEKKQALGAEFESGPDWTPHAVRDGGLITGQNPQSSGKCAALLVEALSSK